jgi:Ca2+-transporting ATPase
MSIAPLVGLSTSEVQKRLATIGYNDMPREADRGLLRISLETMREPMFLLLLGAASLYLVLGDLIEGLFLAAGAMASIGLVVLQEARSERALATLRDLAQPFARVVRDGTQARVPTRELVTDDVVLIGEGDRLPADVRLVGGDVLTIDESALTGESVPATKLPARPADAIEANPVPGKENSPYLFAGTLIVRGQGVAIVIRTGARSALGQIGASLAAIDQQQTPLQLAAGRLVARLGALALGFCGLVAVGYGVIRHDWIGGVLAGITVAISLIPEEFPMVLAVFLALGAWRLAMHKVLTRRSAVIETLGGASALCVDKTGTLTENRMRVAQVFSGSDHVELSDAEVHECRDGPAGELIRIATLASAVRPVDPMDRAIRSLKGAALATTVFDGEPEAIWPLRPELMAVVQIWPANGEGRIAAAKGAPEAIWKLCRLSANEIAMLQLVVERYAETGLRVLGVASARTSVPLHENPSTIKFTFAGLLGFIDPVRSDVPVAIAEARAAGITVIMITGDHPATAIAIAKSAGLDTSAGALIGSDLASLTIPELSVRLRSVRVCARIAPDQKLRIVEALKADGHVVAMTGDGVNDAPALRAAHIGIAMGKKGTDVAREAADLVLLDDSFASIIGGIGLGRRIFSNLRRALTYITAIHVPIAGLALCPILLGLPPLLFPMHVVLMELAIDPTCAIVFEAEPSDANAMTRPPRKQGEALFGSRQIGLALLQGLAIFIGVLGLYAWALRSYPEQEARGAAFTSLVLANLVLALADSAGAGGFFASKRRAYWLISAGVVSLLLAILWVPIAGKVWQVARPSASLLLIATSVAFISGFGTRLFRARRGRRSA